jgi:hypothetical protein
VLVIVVEITTANSKASAAPVLANSATSISDSAGPLDATAISGNVEALVPGVSIVPDDNLPHVLDRGHTYHASFLIWVAPNAGHAMVKAQVDTGSVRGCSSSKLNPGSGVAFTCAVRPDSKHVAVTNMTIDVIVSTTNLGQYTRTYRHGITG